MCDTCGCNITHGNESLIKPGGKLAKTESGKEAVSVLNAAMCSRASVSVVMRSVRSCRFTQT